MLPPAYDVYLKGVPYQYQAVAYFEMASYYEFNGVKVYYAGGEGSPLPSKTGGPIIIDEIRKKYNKDNLFVDPDFPPEFSSIGNIGGDKAQQLSIKAKEAQKWEWLRVPDLAKGMKVKKVAFAYDASGSGNPFNETDVIQGQLGDCWYVAALADLTTDPTRLRMVVPEDNDNGFDDGNYCGAFHFRFYDPAFDKWVDVVVDDFLPASKVTREGGKIKKARSAFTKLAEKTSGAEVVEAWAALAEKAYAKYHGGYVAIEGGFQHEALINFTSGFGEKANFLDPDKHENMEGVEFSTPLGRLKTLLKAYLGANGFVGLGTFSESSTPKEAAAGYDEFGLLHSHAYSVFGVTEVEENDGSASYYLLKVRNPHGKSEWKGDFSDGNAKWEGIRNPPKDLVVKEEGSFYMKIEDAMKYFKKACFVVPDNKVGVGPSKLAKAIGTWPADLQSAEISSSKRSCKYFTGYKFEVTQGDLPQETKDKLGDRTFVTITVVLHGSRADLEPKPGFSYHLYKVDDDADLEDLEEFYRGDVVAEAWNSKRDASGWTMLDSVGTYLVVPVLSTKKIPEQFAGKDIGFTVRVYAPNKVELQEIPPSETP